MELFSMLHTLCPTNIHHSVAKIKKQIALHVAMSITFKTRTSYHVTTKITNTRKCTLKVYCKEKIILKSVARQQNLNQTCVDFCQQLLIAHYDFCDFSSSIDISPVDVISPSKNSMPFMNTLARHCSKLKSTSTSTSWPWILTILQN